MSIVARGKSNTKSIVALTDGQINVGESIGKDLVNEPTDKAANAIVSEAQSRTENPQMRVQLMNIRGIGKTGNLIALDVRQGGRLQKIWNLACQKLALQCDVSQRS